jgi:hypothetical protein
MTIRKVRQKYILVVAIACIAWVFISAAFHLPPSGLFYSGSSLVSCTARLKEVEAMKATYALDMGLEDGSVINPSDLHRHFDGRIPKCPGGGTYTYNKLGGRPVCSFSGSTGLKPEKELIMYFFWRWKIPPSGRHEL